MPSSVKNNSTLFLAVSSLVSQLLGFLRDKLLSYIYGAGFLLDTYYAAFRVPEFIYLTIGSFASSAILVPLFANKFKEDKTGVKSWFQKLFTTFLVFFAVVYLFIILILPNIIQKLYFHSNSEFRNSIIIYGSVLLVSTFFLSLSSIISSVSQVKRSFFRVGVAPIFYNLGTILGIVFLRPHFGILGVCVGVVVGSMLHLLVQLPDALKMGLFKGYFTNVRKSFSFVLLKNTLAKSTMRTVSLCASAVTFFLITYFASLYKAGSISIISLAFSLQTVFHTLLGVSYATTILPTLADSYAHGNFISFDEILRHAVKKIFLISTVVTSLVYLFKFEIVYILFGGGKFNIQNVYYTSLALGVFIISLYAQNLILLLSRASYAKGNYLSPLITNILSAVMMFVFGNIFYKLYAAHDYGFLSVAFSYSLSMYIALAVCILLYKKEKYIHQRFITIKYGLYVLLIASVVTISSRYILSIVTKNQNTILAHIMLSILVFAFYAIFTYVLLGTIKDQDIRESRVYIKNLILALFPKKR